MRPFLEPLYFAIASSIIGLIFWSLWSAARDTVEVAQKMHQIPCTKCRFFTNDYHLKCTIRPTIANTEEAIDCSDYCNS